jgi:hypothetical protein
MPAATEGAESAVVVGVRVPCRDAQRRVWQAIELARRAHRREEERRRLAVRSPGAVRQMGPPVSGGQAAAKTAVGA